MQGWQVELPLRITGQQNLPWGYVYSWNLLRR